jgi:hypothetical protein
MRIHVCLAALAAMVVGVVVGCQSARTGPADKSAATDGKPSVDATARSDARPAEDKKDPAPSAVDKDPKKDPATDNPPAKVEPKTDVKKTDPPEATADTKPAPPPEFKPTGSIIVEKATTACAKCDKGILGATECGLVIRDPKTGRQYLVFNAAEVNKELYSERHKDNETKVNVRGPTDGKLIKAESITRYEEKPVEVIVEVKSGPQVIKKIAFVDLKGNPLSRAQEAPLRRLAVGGRLKEGALFDKKVVQQAMDALQPFIDAGSGVKFDDKTGTLEFKINPRSRDEKGAAAPAPAPAAVAAAPSAALPVAAPAPPAEPARPAEVLLVEGDLVCTKCVLGATADCRAAVRKGALVYVLTGAKLGEHVVKACHAGDRKVSFVGRPAGAAEGRLASVEVLSAKLLAE